MIKYPAYKDVKDSGLPWVGKIPTHWQVQRLKNLFQLEKRPPRDDDKIVTAFRDGQVTLRENRRTEGFTNSLKEIGYQGVRVGDLVIHAMDAFAGAIGVSDADGKSTPVYSVATPRAGVNVHYFGRMLRYMALSGFVTSLAKGIRERSTEFRWADASVLDLPLPPLSEQHAICLFLDRETAKIDALIEEQQRLIELLKEKRQAVISHAVTKGLDPSVPMKDSGVEWLGQVPAHWDVCSLGYKYQVQLGKMLDEKKITGTNSGPYLRNVDVQWTQINTDDLPTMDFSGDDLERYSLKPGDLLVCEGGEVGRAAIWIGDIEPCYYQKALHRLRPFLNSEEPEYLLYCFWFYALSGVFSGSEGRSTIQHLTAETLRKYRFPFPPASEQKTIAAYVRELVNAFNSLSIEAERATNLLRERRAALISAAVTGKIDVRGLVSDDAEAA